MDGTSEQDQLDDGGLTKRPVIVELKSKIGKSTLATGHVWWISTHRPTRRTHLIFQNLTKISHQRVWHKARRQGQTPRPVLLTTVRE